MIILRINFKFNLEEHLSRKVKRFQIAMKDTLIKVEVRNVYLRYTETKSITILERYSHVIFLFVLLFEQVLLENL